MKVIDLSWPITNGTIVFPGDISPDISVKSTVEQDGCATRRLSFSSHTGTHIDAPAHMLASGKTLDALAPETYFGLAQAADVTRCVGRQIEAADIEASLKDVKSLDFVLLNTGWSAKWGNPLYLEGYPVLSETAAGWLAEQGLKGIGVDTISIDAVSAADCGIHKILMAKGLIVIENLRRLDLVSGEPFCLAALPLPLERADGAPARVMAVLD